MPAPAYDRAKIRQALQILNIDQLVLCIHDASFPGLDDEDLGRGSPYSHGGRAFVRFAHELGFDTMALGPQGQTTRINPSPYDGSVFSRNLLSLAPGPLASASQNLISSAHLQRLLQAAPVSQGGAARNRVDHAYASNSAQGLLDGAFATYQHGGAAFDDMRARFGLYLSQTLRPGSWLERDAVFQVLSSQHGTDDWRLWPLLDQQLYSMRPAPNDSARRRLQTLLATSAPAIERYAWGQFLLQTQHDDLRREVAQLRMRLYGDLQVGYAHQDLWAYGHLFLERYRLGAPPSRTNPEGQAWGYPVLDPALYGDPLHPGPSLGLMQGRVAKLFAEFDGLRIDHPHGLVCPWVYRTDDVDGLRAVQNGARLFASPALPDHPELAALSIVTADQINLSAPRHADDWVQNLSVQQRQRYAVVLDAILAAAESQHGRDGVLCEVLSTWPEPLRAVMKERGLGRFCVTQKTDPHVERDLYRSEHLAAQDWIMVGNHDTPPLRLVVSQWQETPHLEARAQHLATRLIPQLQDRPAFVAKVVRDPRQLCNALFAELFASKARHVSIFFADLLGLTEVYNRPGVQDERNWTLRVPHDYAKTYPANAHHGEALDLRRALALALAAQNPTPDALNLAQRLEEEAGDLP